MIASPVAVSCRCGDHASARPAWSSAWCTVSSSSPGARSAVSARSPAAGSRIEIVAAISTSARGDHRHFARIGGSSGASENTGATSTAARSSWIGTAAPGPHSRNSTEPSSHAASSSSTPRIARPLESSR
jgi:hypothetical protein